MYGTSEVDRYMVFSTLSHMRSAKRIMRYLITTMDYGIFYPTANITPLSIEGFVYSDWAGCTKTRRSTTGFILTINQSPVVWKSQRQTITALSSAEAEYVALSSCAKEIQWLRSLFTELCFQKPLIDISYEAPATLLYSDNTAAVSIATAPVISQKGKHIETKYHHVRSLVLENRIFLQHIPTTQQPADMLTKSSSCQFFSDNCKALNIMSKEYIDKM